MYLRSHLFSTWTRRQYLYHFEHVYRYWDGSYSTTSILEPTEIDCIRTMSSSSLAFDCLLNMIPTLRDDTAASSEVAATATSPHHFTSPHLAVKVCDVTAMTILAFFIDAT
jgi:hypothetical protein